MGRLGGTVLRICVSYVDVGDIMKVNVLKERTFQTREKDGYPSGV